MPRPAAVLFDLGDTLLEERGYHLAAGVEALLRDPALATRHDAREAPGLAATLQATIDEIHRTNESDLRMRDWLVEQLSPDAEGVDFAAVEHALFRRIAHLEPMPGVGDVLDTLRRDGVRVGVVSNAIFSADTLAAELARHGLREPFEFVLSSADVGVRKPGAEIFETALAHLGLAPRDVWFVGDSFTNDIEGAAGVGMWPVWLLAAAKRPSPPGSSDLPAHAALESWSAFLSYWREL